MKNKKRYLAFDLEIDVSRLIIGLLVFLLSRTSCRHFLDRKTLSSLALGFTRVSSPSLSLQSKGKKKNRKNTRGRRSHATCKIEKLDDQGVFIKKTRNLDRWMAPSYSLDPL